MSDIMKLAEKLEKKHHVGKKCADCDCDLTGKEVFEYQGQLLCKECDKQADLDW